MWRCLRLGSLGRDAEMEYCVVQDFLGRYTCGKGRKTGLGWRDVDSQGGCIWGLSQSMKLELRQSFRVSKIEARGLALVSLITYSLGVNYSCRKGMHSSYLLLCNNYSKLNNLKQQTCYYILQMCGLGNQTGLGWLIFLIYISSTGVSLCS